MDSSVNQSLAPDYMNDITKTIKVNLVDTSRNEKRVACTFSFIDVEMHLTFISKSLQNKMML